MKKYVFYSELAYILGLVLLALGTAVTAQMDLGISMVVAPAYVLYLKVSEYLPFFSFGMAEYVLQAAVLLLLTLIMRKGKLAYLLSFATAVFYGVLLDAAMGLAACLPCDLLAARIGFYMVGMLLCTAAIALLFRSYLPPAAYEMFVKEIANKFGWNIHRVKTVYDCVSCLLAVAMSLLLLGNLRGVGIATVVCALVYGTLIGWFDKRIGRYFTFRDRFSWRKYL